MEKSPVIDFEACCANVKIVHVLKCKGEVL